MDQVLTVEHVTGDSLQKVWDSCTNMAQTMSYPSVFCCGDWLESAAKQLLPKESLLVLTVKAESNVKAVLPIYSKPNALGGRDLHFLGSDFYPDPIGLICAPEDRVASIGAIKSYLFSVQGWDRLFLACALEDEYLAWGALGNPISIQRFKILHSDFSYLLKMLKRQNRRYLQGKTRRLQDAGGCLISSKDSETHSDFIEALFNLHRKRAAERNIHSSFSGSRVEQHHRTVCKNSKNVRFYGIKIEEKIVAVIYGFEFCRIFSAYQIAHDPSCRELGVGTVLLYSTIKECCEGEVVEFNFLQGDERYKEIWTNESRVLYQIIVRKGGWRTFFFDISMKARNIMKIFLKRSRDEH